MRTLTWYLASVGPGANQKETYRLDRGYNPVRVWMHSDAVPIDQELLVDINVDGVSIFSYQPRMRDEKDMDSTDFAVAQLNEGALVTLDVDQQGGNTRGLTVGLELEEA